MSEIQAIAWVLGGLMAIFSAYVTIKSAIEKRDMKRDSEKEKEVKEKLSLEANWIKTDEHEKSIERLDKLCESNTMLMNELISQRRIVSELETVKTNALYHLLSESDTTESNNLKQQINEKRTKLIDLGTTLKVK